MILQKTSSFTLQLHCREPTRDCHHSLTQNTPTNPDFSATPAYFTTASGETLPATPAFQGRYARFKTRLSSTDGLHTPTFGNVHLSFIGAGLLASSCNNFAYDPAGNTTSIETVTDASTTVDERNSVANPINALNQILQRDVGGVSWLFSYDLNGNLIGKTDGTDTFIYGFNDDNRLMRGQGPGGLDVSYTYDTSGRMMTRTSGVVTTRLTWDGFDCVREETGSSVTIYHIPGGMLHSFSLDGAVYQVHADALGSVRMITDAGGAVVARLEYGAWGEEIFVSAIPALASFPYRFVGGAGCRTDSAVGLVYMRNRWYDPTLQRFVSRDAVIHQNRYAYGANSPVNFVDPNGLEATRWDVWRAGDGFSLRIFGTEARIKQTKEWLDILYRDVIGKCLLRRAGKKGLRGISWDKDRKWVVQGPGGTPSGPHFNPDTKFIYMNESDQSHRLNFSTSVYGLDRLSLTFAEAGGPLFSLGHEVGHAATGHHDSGLPIKASEIRNSDDGILLEERGAAGALNITETRQSTADKPPQAYQA